MSDKTEKDIAAETLDKLDTSDAKVALAVERIGRVLDRSPEGRELDILLASAIMSMGHEAAIPLFAEPILKALSINPEGYDAPDKPIVFRG